MIMVMGLLAVTIVLFAFEILRVDVAAIAVMVLLGLSTMLPGLEPVIAREELFSGFSSNAVHLGHRRHDHRSGARQGRV